MDLYQKGRYLYSYFFGGDDKVDLDCASILVDDFVSNNPELFDGKNALQYGTYIIKQGPHEGKRILACKCLQLQVPLKHRTCTLLQ